MPAVLVHVRIHHFKHFCFSFPLTTTLYNGFSHSEILTYIYFGIHVTTADSPTTNKMQNIGSHPLSLTNDKPIQNRTNNNMNRKQRIASKKHAAEHLPNSDTESPRALI